MQISFNPPLGDAVNVVTPPLLPETHTTPLLFTAQLSAIDHDLLVSGGGRVQLWSNVPHDGERNGEWGELDFTDTPASDRRSSGTYTIQLGENLFAEDRQTKTLYLLIFLPPTTSGTKDFSFTYRIAYASGEVTWLGAFEQNGAVMLQPSPPNSLGSLVLEREWDFDLSRRVQRLEIREKAGILQIAKVSLSDFRIWALGTHSFVPHFGIASLLFLVPHIQRHSLVLKPTYVMAASPGLTMTLSEEGALTTSGSGTILFQVHEIQSEIQPFAEHLILHSMLQNWSMVSSDSQSKTLILALTGPSHPVHAVVIPLWPSDYLASTFRLDLAKLANTLGNDMTEDFGLFSPFKRHLYYLSPPGKEDPENLQLEVDPTGSDFTLSSVYRLRTHKLAIKRVQRNWRAIILTAYNTVSPPLPADDCGILPTPPPSPHSRPTGLMPTPSESLDALSLLSSVPSLASSSIKSIGNVAGNSNVVYEDPAVDEDQNLWPSSGPIKSTPSRNVLLLFKSFFSSFGIFLRVFFTIFWCPIIPFAFVRNARSSQIAVEDPKVENPDDDLFSSNETRDIHRNKHASDTAIAPQIGVQTTITTVSENGDTCPNAKASSPTLLEVKVSGTKNIVSSGASHAPLGKSESEDGLYVELMCNRNGTVPSRSTAAIVLIPSSNDTLANANGDLIEANSMPDLDDRLEQAIKFLDGASPRCTTSKVDLIFYNASSKDLLQKRRVQGTDYCDLLQYELDWEGTRKGSVISISSPEGSSG